MNHLTKVVTGFQEVTVLNEGVPLFAQIAEQLSDEIAEGGLAEGDRVPSSNELAAFHRINPATAAKGINMLISQGLVEKRRGVGMFVSGGAREQLLAERRTRFAQQYIEPMLTEAKRVGIDHGTLLSLIEKTTKTAEDYGNGTGDFNTGTDAQLPRDHGG